MSAHSNTAAASGCESAAQSRPLPPAPPAPGVRGGGARRKGGRRILPFTQEHKSADRQESYPALKRLKAKLVNSLRQLGRHSKWGRMADDLQRCHEYFRGFQCKPKAHRWAKPVHSCQFKLCPFCMRARRGRSLARYRKALADRSKRWRFVTLTIRNTRYLDEGREKLWKSFERLRHRVIWTRNVRGAIARGEITWNAKAQTWHPHIHILYDGEYIPHEWLAQQWEQCTGGQGERVVDIREIPFDRLGEVVKYITKVADFADDPLTLQTFLLDTNGHRFVRCYGSLYALEREEEESEKAACPDCGSREIEFVGFVAPQQLSLDLSGVLRFDSEETSACESPPDDSPPFCETHGWNLPCRVCVRLNTQLAEGFVLQFEPPRLFADLAAD